MDQASLNNQDRLILEKSWTLITAGRKQIAKQRTKALRLHHTRKGFRNNSALMHYTKDRKRNIRTI